MDDNEDFEIPGFATDLYIQVALQKAVRLIGAGLLLFCLVAVAL